ncbi:MAG: hypothetical protein HKN04_14945 [Rhodothermaceae bacterium]|nr:hypothetical protein [Rhodothermaceae bacterium]
MQQTILALAAILAFSMFALNQHRATADVEHTANVSELELAATDVARQRLLEIAGFAFDDADVGRSGLRTDETGLTPAANFGLGGDAGEDASSLPDDLDDFHGITDSVAVNWHGTDVQVLVASSVRYVQMDAPDRAAASATLAKEITVLAVNLTNVNRPVVSRLVQVVTPAWKAIHG